MPKWLSLRSDGSAMLPSIDSVMTRPSWRRSSGTNAIPAVIAAVGRAFAQGRAHNRDVAGVVAIDPEHGSGHLATPGPDQPGQRDDLPGVDMKEMSKKTPPGSSVDLEDDVGPPVTTFAWASCSMSRPTIALTRSSPVSPSAGGPIPAAVAHYGDPLANGEHLLEPVTDEKDGLALAAQGIDHPEKPLDLVCGERRGGLVHHDDPRLERQRLGDLNDLLVSDR